MLKSLLPKVVELIITIDDVRLTSKLTTNKTLRFTKMLFFYTILGFTGSHSGDFGDIEGFVQSIPGTYKNNKPVNITGIDKIHLKADCIIGRKVNGVRKPILYSSGLSSPPGHKIYKETRITFLKKISKSVLSHITFYLEDDDHKPVDFLGGTISFASQLIKI